MLWLIVTTLPQYKIEAIARCILSDILAFYENDEGQREFTKWKRQQKSSKGANGKTINTFSVAATENT